MNSSLFWMRRSKKLKTSFVDMVAEMFYREIAMLRDLEHVFNKTYLTGGASCSVGERSFCVLT